MSVHARIQKVHHINTHRYTCAHARTSAHTHTCTSTHPQVCYQLFLEQISVPFFIQYHHRSVTILFATDGILALNVYVKCKNHTLGLLLYVNKRDSILQ